MRVFNRCWCCGLLCALAWISTPLTASGSFTLSNGYFELSGDEGLINSLRLDSSGTGNYGSNTIAAGSHFGFLLNDTLLTSPSATAQVNDNILQIQNLPGGATFRVTLTGNRMAFLTIFSGTALVRHEWNLPYIDEGFYQRSTGHNYSPDVDIDMPFESFYNLQDGKFRPIEHFKKSAGETLALDWPRTYCRGRTHHDVILDLSNASTHFRVESDRLILFNEVTTSGYSAGTIDVLPKTYSVTLDGNKPLPEFYVLPEQQVVALSDPGVIHKSSDLLTELFQHSVFWFGPSGGIWSDWSMRAGSFMNNSYRDNIVTSIRNWVVGDDGYGHPGHAYVWYSERNWPFPGDREDRRHFDTNAIYITAVWRYIMWSGDLAFLDKGASDHVFRIRTAAGNQQYSLTQEAHQLTAGGTLGQTFTASEPFTGVSTQNPNWATTGAGFTLTLYDRLGGTAIASQSFLNVADGSFNELTFPQQPAGTYYLEMSDPVGTIGWWGSSNEAYPNGEAYRDRYPIEDILNRMRSMMTYQQQTLLGEQEGMLVLGANTGTLEHAGRHGQDTGTNYYDILPFGYKCAYTNMWYYLSLRAMADLEEIVGNAAAAQSLRNHLDVVRDNYHQAFWRTGLDRGAASRFIGCIDINSVEHDYGYSFINTMAVEAGLTAATPARTVAMFDWLDRGESQHSTATVSKFVRVGYVDGSEFIFTPNLGSDKVPVQLNAGEVLEQSIFIAAPFDEITVQTPTWGTTGSGFTLTVYRKGTGEQIASQSFSNVSDNAYTTMTFSETPRGVYVVRLSQAVGTIGWWASPWAVDLCGQWVFAPRVSTKNNTDWWSYPVGDPAHIPTWPQAYDPTRSDFFWRWDRQLQNGGSDLYESGYEIMARAKFYDADSAWERMSQILARYSDPDRLCSKYVGFYGEGIQGDGVAFGGAVGWMRSEFPETCVLGASFFLGFFGIEPVTGGIVISPRIPTSHGITDIGARNISFWGGLFNFEANESSVRVDCVSNPTNRTFYMTGSIESAGTFSVNVPLEEGSMVLNAITPQGTLLPDWLLY